ncbi:MAG TPA: T9SS type A sorting domain-containing protein [Candidatus Kapabacteria bacterium]|nr:T9SS type A sorting domain-containing protein [Candidatus Kapabacteria bacterium]
MKTKILLLIATTLLFVLQSYSCLSKQDDDLIWEKLLENTECRGAKFTPDGSKIIAVSGGYIFIVDTETSEILYRFEEIATAEYYTIEISKNQPLFVVRNGGNNLYLFNYEQKKQIKELGFGYFFSFSGDGKYIAIGLGNETPYNLKIYDIEKDSIIESKYLSQYFMNNVSAVEFSDDGKYLAVAYSGYQIENQKYEYSSILALFNTDDWSLVKNLNYGESGKVADLAFSPDGSKLAATYIEGEAKTIIWDMTDFSEKWRYNGGGIAIPAASISFTNDSKNLLISNRSKIADHTTEIFNLDSNKIIYIYYYSMRSGIDISNNSKYICSPLIGLRLYKLQVITNIYEKKNNIFYIIIGNNVIDISEINIEEILNISISDINGKEIINYTKTQIKTDGNNIYIDENHLLSGAYFCTIKTRNKVITKKFIASK